MSTEPATEHTATHSLVARCQARLRIFASTLVSDDDQTPEIPTGVASLSFDYGGTHIQASDPRQRFFRTSHAGMVSVERDKSAELTARRLIESFGVTETACLDGLALSRSADYIIDVDSDVHALCTFTAYAIPQLRTRGVHVEVTADYPWQVVEASPSWYADIDQDDRGWFNFELGVEIDGERQNLLPILLEILEHPAPGLDLETLARSPRRRIGLRLGHTRYLAIAPERLCNILRVLLELHQQRDQSQNRLYASAMQAASITHLERVFEAGELTLHDRHNVARHGRKLTELGHDPAWTPAGLQAVLRPYQRQGLAWLTDLAVHQLGGILADDMGLGKTIQVIAHLLHEKSLGRLQRPALVVAPTSLVGNWQRELVRFAPSLRFVAIRGPRRPPLWAQATTVDVVITSYPVVLRDERHASLIDFSLIILDEAQTIKNRHSQIHRTIHALCAERRLCLSGTPMENHLGELWALFDCVAPGLLGDAASFHQTFAVPIEKTGSIELLQALRRRVQPFILRRQKRDVAPELPAKTEIVRPVDLVGEQRDLYETIRLAAHEQVRSAVTAQGVAQSTIAILDALMKLRQVCCDPRLLRLDAARGVRASAKYHLLFDLLEPQLAQGHRILVFSQFTSMLALIAKGLSERNLQHAILTGSTHDRQKEVDAFQQQQVPVFLISLKAGGTGLNLTAADTVIHYDPWWNPAAQAQATDRAYRIGQTRPVFVYNLIVAGSVEERILALQRKKRDLADNLLGGGDGATLQLTVDDVEELLAPLDANALI